jgi:hypothetical protein
MLGKPYTMYEARSGYSKEFGRTPLFVKINIVITKMWVVIYSINVIMKLVVESSVNIMIMSIVIELGILPLIIISGAFPEA